MVQVRWISRRLSAQPVKCKLRFSFLFPPTMNLQKDDSCSVPCLYLSLRDSVAADTVCQGIPRRRYVLLYPLEHVLPGERSPSVGSGCGTEARSGPPPWTNFSKCIYDTGTFAENCLLAGLVMLDLLQKWRLTTLSSCGTAVLSLIVNCRWSLAGIIPQV